MLPTPRPLSRVVAPGTAVSEFAIGSAAPPSRRLLTAGNPGPRRIVSLDCGNYLENVPKYSSMSPEIIYLFPPEFTLFSGSTLISS